MYTKILLLIIFFISSITAKENFCVVLDLISDGSVSKSSCSLLSHTINKILIIDGRYNLFDRKVLSDLLKQFDLYKLSHECYDQECLATIGNLIGAQIIIGGKAVYKNKSISIILNMIDVKQKKKIQTVTINTRESKKRVIKEEIPIIVEMLLESETSYQLSKFNQKKKSKNIKRRKLPYKNLLFYTGAIFVGGASGILCYYFINKKEKKIDDKPLSMDDVPQRTRYNEQ